MRLSYDGPEITNLYWPNIAQSVYQNGRTNYNSSRFAMLDDIGRFLSSDKFEFNASDVGSRIKHRLTMEIQIAIENINCNLPHIGNGYDDSLSKKGKKEALNVLNKVPKCGCDNKAFHLAFI